jgi:hypothetical protein
LGEAESLSSSLTPSSSRRHQVDGAPGVGREEEEIIIDLWRKRVSCPSRPAPKILPLERERRGEEEKGIGEIGDAPCLGTGPEKG